MVDNINVVYNSNKGYTKIYQLASDLTHQDYIIEIKNTEVYLNSKGQVTCMKIEPYKFKVGNKTKNSVILNSNNEYELSNYNHSINFHKLTLLNRLVMV